MQFSKIVGDKKSFCSRKRVLHLCMTSMKKVRIVLPLNEKKQNYGYMRPLKTREKSLYSKKSRLWHPSKKKGLGLFAQISSCFHNIANWNNMKEEKAVKMKKQPEGAAEHSVHHLQQLYLCSLLMGKIK